MKDQFQAMLKGFGRRRRSVLSDGPSIRAILGSGLFDPQWYAGQQPNLPSVLDLALGHYLEVGWKAGLDPGPKFSTNGYLAANPEIALSGTNPLVHYVMIGRLQGRAPGFERDGTNMQLIARIVGSEFDSAFYMRENQSASRAGFSPLGHFLSSGWKDGRDPHPQFSISYYLEANPDVRSAGINPYYHYLVAGRREGRTPNADVGADAHAVAVRAVIAREFDAAYYTTAYDDVRGSGIDALTHYMERGWRDGRNPNAEFSTSFYLSEHSDVRDAGIEPFYHYLTEGRREGRATSAAMTGKETTEADLRNAIAAEFDADFYLAQNPDVARAGVDPIVHYLRHGWREGRDPHPRFSTLYYLGAYPDVRDAGVNPFYHFLAAGRIEGRLPVHPGGWKVKVLQSLQPVSQRRSAAAESVIDVGSGDGAIGRIRQALTQPSARFVISLSQDNYTTSVGGVQLCIKLEEEAACTQGLHYLNLHPARAMPFLSQSTDPDEMHFGVVFDGTFVGNIAAEKLIGVLSAARRSGARADLVVHSLLGHSTEALISLHSAVVPGRSLFWLHDYFSVCPSFTLLRNDISYCGAPPVQSPACSVCVFGEERQSHVERLREAFLRIPFEVVSPSAFTRDLWLRSVDLEYKGIGVHGHCAIEWSEEANVIAKDAPIRIAFVGHPANHKGWQLFLQLIEEFEGDERYEFHHFGSGSRQHAKAKFSKASVIEDGPTAMRDALAILDIDAVLMWSIWPETFSFVAHEALSSGAMLLTCEQSGNVACLTRDSSDGVVYPDEQALLRALRESDLYEALVRRRESIRRGTPVFGKMSMDLLEGELELSR